MPGRGDEMVIPMMMVLDLVDISRRKNASSHDCLSVCWLGCG